MGNGLLIGAPSTHANLSLNLAIHVRWKGGGGDCRDICAIV